GGLRMPALPNFMVAPLPVKPEHRNTPTIDRGRIDLAVGVCIGDHLSPHREPDRRPVVAAIIALELQAIAATRGVFVNVPHETVGGLLVATPDLDVIS